MTCTVFWKQTVWLSRYESHLLSKWFLIQLFRLFFLSSKKKKKTHAWVWLTIVSRGVAPSIRWFWKVAGFLKNQEGLINLLLQRSGTFEKVVLAVYYQVMSLLIYSIWLQTNLFVTDEHDCQDLRKRWFKKLGLSPFILLKFCFLHNMTWL